jgi:hypothetical protein
MRKTTHSPASSVPADILRKTWMSCRVAIRPQTPATFDARTSCRQLFDVLDGRRIIAANQPWQITVYAVVDDGVSRWVQMLVAGKTVNEVTIRIESGAGTKPAIRALTAWLNATPITGTPRAEVVATARSA